MRRLVLMLGVVMWGLAPASSATQLRAIDAEQLLANRFHFIPEEIARARAGEPIAKALDTNATEDLGVVAAIRVSSTSDRLVYWFNDIANFRHAAQLGLARRIHEPPQATDFTDLTLDASDLASIKDCRPGHCELLMGDSAIGRFQADVDWKAPDPTPQANAVLRRLLMDYAASYLRGGNAALGVLHNEKNPKALVDEFHQALWQAKGLYDVVPDLAAYLDGFPGVKLAGSQSFLYWAKSTLAAEPSISLHQMVIYHAPGGEVCVIDKQLFANRHTEAMLTVFLLASTPDGKGFYVIAGARARSSMLNSLGARLMRGKVEQAVLEQTQLYLGWIRDCLAL